ncbi:MAG: hypothetical protein QOH85_1451, partial [Acidobacteriaceae bacterium]|nr:hypothetical protein [Acidobacteriaceae bacterium]
MLSNDFSILAHWLHQLSAYLPAIL